jgi:ADP-ribosylglycohydrolase
MIPPDYEERVYAGVLGKIIGVYLGRPFEGWSYERITRELGEIWYYVHEKLGKPLIVTDDDISGTFTFLRALEDYGYPREITPAQIGRTWLNYLIEHRTVLWWGGLGNSTEHTAYLRLKSGIEAPYSGSIALNGETVAGQIGAQIFIDGWAMVAPGDPELAAELARRAASVSHDGEAIYGAQVLAAMEALAFVEPDIHRLIETAVALIPRDSIIYRMIGDVREWREQEPDWRRAFGRLAANYGYDRYGGNCHIVPNHGLIILSLLYGDDDFQKTLMIVNTCGWDTDCNSGNVGCLMGIKNGLAGIEAGPDWRGPVADRLYIPTADGGGAVTDAVSVAYRIVNTGRALAGLPPRLPKNGARFHFELPGAVQGFRADESVESRGLVTLENVTGHSRDGTRSLALRYTHLAPGRMARVCLATFIPPEAVQDAGYGLVASPTLYPGQTLRARLESDGQNREPPLCRLYLRAYGPDDTLYRLYGPEASLPAGTEHEFVWQIPDTGGDPIAEIGIEIRSLRRADGCLYLDYLTWDGPPRVTWTRPAHNGTMWRRAWVNGVDDFLSWSEPYRLIQNHGVGLLIQGTREWSDYRVTADVTPHLARAAGIAARVQGMRRYYALLLCDDGKIRLVKALDGDTVLAEADWPWTWGETHKLGLEVAGNRLRAWVDGEHLFTLDDTFQPLDRGAVALVIHEGRTATHEVRVEAVTNLRGQPEV